MKIEWVDDLSGRSGLVVKETSRFDGAPQIESFWLDKKPLSLNQDRLAIAVVLIFAKWSMGSLILPKQVGALTARELMRHREPHWIIPEPIDYGPKPIPSGPGTLYLMQKGKRYEPITSEQYALPIDYTLTVLDSDEFSGALSSMREFCVASNAFAFQALDLPSRILPLLAVGVLFAEDLRCSTICIDRSQIGDYQSIESLRRVLETTGLQLILV